LVDYHGSNLRILFFGYCTTQPSNLSLAHFLHPSLIISFKQRSIDQAKNTIVACQEVSTAPTTSDIIAISKPITRLMHHFINPKFTIFSPHRMLSEQKPIFEHETAWLIADRTFQASASPQFFCMRFSMDIPCRHYHVVANPSNTKDKP